MTEEIKKNITDILEKLKKNTMFRLSLTSKELFHSNFLAWIFETYKEECSDIFGIPELKNIKSIKREVNLGKNRNNKKCIADIVIESNNDEKVIIENKFKCLPDLNQLKDYNDCLKDAKTKKIILLSYFKPLFYDNSYEYKTYEDLCENLNKLINRINNDDDNKVIIKNYMECLKLLNELKESIKIKDDIKVKDIWGIFKDDKDHKDDTLKNELKQINFEKTMQRIYANKLTNYLLSDYDKRKNLTIFIDCGRDLTVYSDIVFCYKNAWNDNEDKREPLNDLGISVWGTNFRYYASVNYKKNGITKGNKNNDSDKEKGYEILKTNYKWFFTDATNRSWGGYRGDKEMYLYQKEDISEKSLSDLKDEVKGCLDKVYENEQYKGLNVNQEAGYACTEQIS